MSEIKTIRAYHFTGDTLRNGDPIPEIGKWLKHKGEIVACKSGLHASEHALDALQYAPGPILHLVELRGDLVSHGSPMDKWAGRERRIIASVDATELLWYSARMFACSVAHLWDAPDAVLDFLMTGGNRDAARDAAWDAAWDAARDAARDAAWDAAWDAARDAAWDAARDAAWVAARDAARDAAWVAARDAAWVAAWAAARAAARDAARDAAWDAAIQENRDLFTSLVDAEFSEYL